MPVVVPNEAMNLCARLNAVLQERYVLERELGRGGMGTVFLACDRRHGRPVAIKVLHPELSPSLGTKRFLAEIKVAANLAHPHIVSVFDSGEAAGLLYYVMPYVEGESLRDRLDRDSRLPVDEALRISLDVTEALAYAHGRGVIHRDIKPENILLAAHGHATVADFGVARALSAASDERLTTTGLIVGSPLYIAPEQADGTGVVDGRADIYSLGCVLHEMLAGAPPFEARGAYAAIFRHLTEPPPPLRSLRAEVPAEVEAAVLHALEKDPARRFGGAEEFRTTLAVPAGTALTRRPLRRPAYGAKALGRGTRIAVGSAVLAALLSLGAPSVLPARTAGPVGVMVLPFDAAGPRGTGSDSDGAPPDRWLASSLALLPVVQVIDARAVIREGENWRALPARALSQRAARGGAKYLITGSLLEGGRERRLTVELHTAEGGRQVYDGAAQHDESVAKALDRLALDIVRVVADAEDIDLGGFREIASATVSLAALTELIQGQRHFRRGDTDAAVESYRRAIQADSSFGPAYFRLSMAETWRPRWNFPAALAAVEAGLRKADQMAPRWVDLLTAQRHYVRRSTDSAAAQFQKVVSENPTLSDALLGYGEVLIHSGGMLGEPATVALPIFRRLVATDSAFAPIDDHLVELALYVGDEHLARTALLRIPYPDGRQASRAAVALRFGDAGERAAAFEALRRSDLRTIATVVAIFVQDRLNLPLADSVAKLLTENGRTPEERVRGARWRMAALAGQGRWPEALVIWDSFSGKPTFDAWIIHAYLAGLPLGERAEPMLRLAQARISNQPPSFAAVDRTEASRLESQDALRAVVHQATLEADSAEVSRVLRIVEDAASTAAPSDPEPEALEASLQARLALLARDTVTAITHLERAVARLPWSTNWYMPLADGATQRLLLAELLAARGDRAGARRRLQSLGQIWRVGDALFFPAVTRVARTSSRGGGERSNSLNGA